MNKFAQTFLNIIIIFSTLLVAFAVTKSQAHAGKVENIIVNCQCGTVLRLEAQVSGYLDSPYNPDDTEEFTVSATFDLDNNPSCINPEPTMEESQIENVDSAGWAWAAFRPYYAPGACVWKNYTTWTIYDSTGSIVDCTIAGCGETSAICQDPDCINDAPTCDGLIATPDLSEYEPESTIQIQAIVDDIDNPASALTYEWDVSAGSQESSAEPDMIFLTFPSAYDVPVTVTYTVSDPSGLSATCFDTYTTYDNYCGDGEIQIPNDYGVDEVCDGTEGVGINETCTSSCTLLSCGDGIKQAENNEECDGNDGVGEHQECTDTCELVNLTYCGDGIMQTPNDEGQFEECDSNVGVGEHQECTDTCELVNLTYCGDSIKQTPNDEGQFEECDGNDGVGDNQRCDTNCNLDDIPPSTYCGDGIKQSPNNEGQFEECDGNDGVGDNQECLSNCQLENLTYCGDDIKQTPNDDGQIEECDGSDGVSNNQECASNCQLENLTYCGDDIKQTPNDDGQIEECDGNDGVGENQECNSSCELDDIVVLPYCGDGIIDPGESCDDGVNNGSDACNAITPYGEECTYCSISCLEITVSGGYCGDDMVDIGFEGCDEGVLNGVVCIPVSGSSCEYCSEICIVEEFIDSSTSLTVEVHESSDSACVHTDIELDGVSVFVDSEPVGITENGSVLIDEIGYGEYLVTVSMTNYTACDSFEVTATVGPADPHVVVDDFDLYPSEPVGWITASQGNFTILNQFYQLMPEGTVAIVDNGTLMSAGEEAYYHKGNLNENESAYEYTEYENRHEEIFTYLFEKYSISDSNIEFISAGEYEISDEVYDLPEERTVLMVDGDVVIKGNVKTINAMMIVNGDVNMLNSGVEDLELYINGELWVSGMISNNRTAQVNVNSNLEYIQNSAFEITIPRLY